VIDEQENQMLKEKYQKEIDEILSRYPVKRSALIPLL
jgi:NADH:ubiquinone oxidoreductase subunit E